MIAQPYSDLRPFNRDEDENFFGRETQVNQLLDRLADTHFLAVLGTSSSGKSSLVPVGRWRSCSPETGLSSVWPPLWCGMPSGARSSRPPSPVLAGLLRDQASGCNADIPKSIDTNKAVADLEKTGRPAQGSE